MIATARPIRKFDMRPFCAACGLAFIAGCATPAGRSAEPVTAAPAREPAVLIIGNDPVGWEELRPRLAEAAGAAVVEEIALDHLLRAELQRSGAALEPSDIERERALFAQTLRRAVPAGDAPPTEQLLTRVRRARALGPDRFEALLRRSAMLRKIAAPTVTVSDDDIAQAMDVRFGPRVRCRLIVVGAEGDAVRLRSRLAAAPPEELQQRFGAEARLLSVDPSSVRDGEIEPVSPADPSFATSFRDAIAQLQPGQLSQVLVFERGYALVLGMERLPAVPPPPGAEADVRADVRQRAERTAMDRLASRLLASAPLTVLDPALNWSWTNRQR